MEVRDDVEVQSGPRRSPFQYSLRSMFVVTTAAAVALSVLVASPAWLIELVFLLLALAIPMVLTVALIYGRGRLRTFSIGALFPAGLVLSMFIQGPPLFDMPISGFPGRLDLEERFFVAFFMMAACAVIVGFGFLAVWVRRMVETSSGRHAEGSDPHTDAPIDTEETRPEPEAGADERRFT
ncbi:MAG TPA: hypothetical protein VMY37_18865 [Thermoguttaceae bacterium]|nr:hypothetical protein [Thermoguttaceae bacterium]